MPSDTDGVGSLTSPSFGSLEGFALALIDVLTPSPPSVGDDIAGFADACGAGDWTDRFAFAP